MFNIIVCIKQILDPEIPPRDFQVDPVSRMAVPGAAALVINPYDENAIEVALQLKEKIGDAKVTAITLGGADTNKALRRALAMGCDQAVCLCDLQKLLLLFKMRRKWFACVARSCPADLYAEHRAA